jgi:hypothetical protein
MILVYQMAKVASMAWVEGARRRGIEALHAHFLTPARLEALEELLAPGREQQTIANPLMVRQVLRSGHAAVTELVLARVRGEDIRLVTGVRDPVARSLSLLFFFADFCDHTERPLSLRGGVQATDLCRFLEESWQAVLDGEAPRGSFERLLWIMIGAYRTWFDDELRESFGIDALGSDFRIANGARRYSSGNAQLLLYRAEDMPRPGVAASPLCAAADEFLGTSGWTFPELNTAATRRSAPLYAQTSAAFRLPSAMLEQIYEAPAVNRFYNTEDIAGFKKRWASL